MSFPRTCRSCDCSCHRSTEEVVVLRQREADGYTYASLARQTNYLYRFSSFRVDPLQFELVTFQHLNDVIVNFCLSIFAERGDCRVQVLNPVIKLTVLECLSEDRTVSVPGCPSPLVTRLPFQLNTAVPPRHYAEEGCNVVR